MINSSSNADSAFVILCFVFNYYSFVNTTDIVIVISVEVSVFCQCLTLLFFRLRCRDLRCPLHVCGEVVDIGADVVLSCAEEEYCAAADDWAVKDAVNHD